MQLITSVGVAAGQYRRRSRITNPVVAQSLSGVRTSQHAGRTHAHCDRRWRLLKSTGQTKRIKPSTHVRVDDAGVAMHTSAASQAGIDAVGVRGAMWFAVTLGLMACVAMTRSPLNRIRLVPWEREIRSLPDGGQTNVAQ